MNQKKKEEEEDDERKEKEEKDKRREDVYDRERKYHHKLIGWWLLYNYTFSLPVCFGLLLILACYWLLIPLLLALFCFMPWCSYAGIRLNR